LEYYFGLFDIGKQMGVADKFSEKKEELLNQKK